MLLFRTPHVTPSLSLPVPKLVKLFPVQGFLLSHVFVSINNSSFLKNFIFVISYLMQSFVTCFFTQPLFRITCVFLPIPPTNGHFRFFCLFVLPFRTVLLVYIFDIFSCKCARYSGHMPPKWNFR